MKLHYKGKYNLDPSSLPYGEHKENAVAFKEIQDTKELGLFASTWGFVIIIVLGIIAFLRCYHYQIGWQVVIGYLCFKLILFPHEMIHALCFKGDVYLYTNRQEGLLFIVGPETMSKSRFIVMSLLPNLIFGFIPYIIGMIFPQYIWLLVLGTLAIGSGFGDYYNVYNAISQMPKRSRTYLYGPHSFWYMP